MSRMFRMIVMILCVVGAASWMTACSQSPDPNASCKSNDDCIDGQRCIKRVCKKIEPTKKKPVAQINGPKQARAQTPTKLDGTGSRDPEGGSLTYQWTLANSPSGSSASLQDVTQATATFTPDIAGRYTISLVVTSDQDVASDPATLEIEVYGKDKNGEPIANAGDDAFGGVGKTLQLDGSGSSDPDGDPLTYAWSFTAKPEGSQANFDDATAAKPSVTFDKKGKYVISLVVSDGLEKSQPDRVSIEILDDYDLEPVVDKITPSSAPVGTNPPIELTGKGFSSLATVLFDGAAQASSDVQVKDANTILLTLNLTARKAGSYDIVVRNPNGKESQPLPFKVTEVPQPTIASVTPPSALEGSKMEITIKGTGFLSASEVLFNVVPLQTTYKSDTELTAQLDLSNTVAGDYFVKVRNPGNRVSDPVAYKVISDSGFPPVVRVLNPPQGTVGSKIPFSVHGSSFAQGAVIVFDGKAIPSLRQSRDTIEADPHLDLSNVAVGKYSVWVRHTNGKESNKETFEVIEKDPPPQLDRILPITFYLNDLTQLDVYGKYFDPKVKIFIGSKEFSGNAIQYRSASFFSVTVDTRQGSWSSGNVQAYVENPNAKKSKSFTLSLTNKPAVPTPVITRLSPTSGETGTTISSFTIYARDFCQSSRSRCSTYPKITIKDKSGVDYQAKYTIYSSLTSSLRTSSPYLRGKLDLNRVPVGVYTIQLENLSTKQKSNTVNFTVAKALPLSLSYVYPYYAKTGQTIKCDVNGGPFASNAYVKIGQDTIPLLSGSSKTRRSFNLDTKNKYNKVGNITMQVCNSANNCSNPFAYPIVPPSGTTPFISSVKGASFPLYTNSKITLYVYGYRWPNATNAVLLIDGKEINNTNFKYSSRSCKLGSSPTSSSSCVFKDFETKSLTPGKHTMQYKHNTTTSITYDFYVEKP